MQSLGGADSSGEADSSGADYRARSGHNAVLAAARVFLQDSGGTDVRTDRPPG